MSARPPAWIRPLTAVTATLLLAGCLLPGRSGTGGGPMGTVALTTRGAEATLRGDPGSVAGSVEDVFRLLDIDLIRRDVDDDGGRMEGQAGIETVLVDMSAAEEERTRVEVRVRTPSGNRWDRAAARGILDEVVRWQAS